MPRGNFSSYFLTFGDASNYYLLLRKFSSRTAEGVVGFEKWSRTAEGVVRPPGLRRSLVVGALSVVGATTMAKILMVSDENLANFVRFP